jgi:hypothetical protein
VRIAREVDLSDRHPLALGHVHDHVHLVVAAFYGLDAVFDGREGDALLGELGANVGLRVQH